MKNVLIILIIVTALAMCSSQKTEEKDQKEIDQTQSMIKENTSYKEVADIKNLSYGNIKRIEVLISIPLGRTEEEVKETLKRAAKEIGDRENPNALVVKGFGEGDKFKHGTYTAGEAIYAPNGKWEAAASSDPMSITIKIGSIYFQDKKTSDIPQKTDEVILVSKGNRLIKISKNRDSWVDEDIIAKLPAGKKAIVLERYEEALTPDHNFVRYLIKVDNIKGWVDGEDIAK